MENEKLKAIKDAEAGVNAASAALMVAKKQLEQARIDAVDSADLNDLAACWALHQALRHEESKIRLTNRIGRHLHPFTLGGKIFSIKQNGKPTAAYIATGMSYNISADGVSVWVNFFPATKAWGKNETSKYYNPMVRLSEMPIERSKSDFEWSAKERAWVFRQLAESEAQNG